MNMDGVTRENVGRRRAIGNEGTLRGANIQHAGRGAAKVTEEAQFSK